MCGITGFLRSSVEEHDRGVLTRMVASLRHRGPDEEGCHVADGVALGVRRLSVIDPATGHQPVTNEDGTIRVVQNGEIYNFRELRERLGRLGHDFTTSSDTEVIAHAYEEYGEKCVDHLDGMFAFAVWDESRRRLFLARDRMGEKPLYYYADGFTFVFGSELRALLEHPAVPRELSLEALSRYLAFEYVPAPDAIIAGVRKLPPGHTLTITAGCKPKLARFWDLTFAAEAGVDEREWERRVLEQLTRSVETRLLSDVPLGMFLSGGVDSSAIVALAWLARGGIPLKTFSLGFAEETYDERPFAKLVAERYRTQHEEVLFSADDMKQLLDDVGQLLDEPLVDGSFLPIYALSRRARENVTVVLSGDGGDEIFCGYPTFQAELPARVIGRLPQALIRLLTAVVNRLPRSSRYGSPDFLLRQFFRGLPHPPEVRTQLLLGGLTAAEQKPLFSPAVRAACADVDPYAQLADLAVEMKDLRPDDRLVYEHCKFYLAEQNLVCVDRASMACGLEVRAPFLDPALVDLAGRIPYSLKLRGVTTKYILKRALRGLVPEEILSRRKQGFGVPIGPWLRGPLRNILEERLASERLRRVGLFDSEAVRRLVDEHVNGERDHRKILWALVMFDAWRERYLPGQTWD